MALEDSDIPVPRSYSEILGDMLEAFVSGSGFSTLKIGNPVLSLFESAAQSDLTGSEDVFTLLEASSLDYAHGPALDRWALAEGLTRATAGPASGKVTVTDTNITKVATKVFQGTAAPIVGTADINVADASSFPASGSIYLGRGTDNYEGPTPYTSITPPPGSGGNYYTIHLTSGTTEFHNVGESVILAQGGDRAVAAGTLCQTPQGNSGTAVSFRFLEGTVLVDGEVVVEGALVVATKPGVSGNIQANSIKGFAETIFAGAYVTNPSPFINGQAAEGDAALRERVRQARQTRTKGTPLALQVFATGVTSLDENKRVLSANVVSRRGFPTTVYIDDGTGYEEVDDGVPIEVFTDLAYGGETSFKVTARPIAQAYVAAENTAPYTLVSGNSLSFRVGGRVTTHTFDADEFRSIGNATAYEVVASINSNYTLNWAARTIDSGSSFVVFAKDDTNEWIENIAVADGDANEFLGFAVHRVDTMRLYKNDKLLVKDGTLAQLESEPLSNWAPLGPTEDLALRVDGTPLTNLVSGTYTFTAQDFIDASTGYASVGKNSLAAWAAVFEYRIPGIEAAVVDGKIVITSNAGLADKASLSVEASSTLVAKGMFTASSSQGAGSDYELDRNTGEISLSTPLTAGDTLTAGTENTRAFIQTPAFSTYNVTVAAAKLWFAVDAGATLIEHGVGPANPLTFSSTAEAWGVRERATGANASFTNVNIGDWLIFWDTASPAAVLNGVYRVAAVDRTFAGVGNSAWVEFDLPTAATPGAYTLTASGLTVVRTDKQLQVASLSVANNYTADGVATALSTQLTGIDTETYRTNSLRARTSSFGEDGDIALVAANLQGQGVGLTASDSEANLASHLASLESGNSDTGTPDFHTVLVVSASGAGDPTVHWDPDVVQNPAADAMFVGLRPAADGSTTALTRYGQNHGYVTAISDVVPSAGDYTLQLRTLPAYHLLGDRHYLAQSYNLASDDVFTVVADGDVEQGRFVVPMWRELDTVGTTYGSTNTFKDADNGGQSLAVGFGYTGAEPFDFNDFALYMAARVKTHNLDDNFSSLNGGGAYSVAYNSPTNNQNDLNRAVLWRYYRLGPDGENVTLRYALPEAEDSAVSVTVAQTVATLTRVSVNLASGNLCSGYTLQNSYKLGTVATVTTDTLTKVFFIFAFKVSSLSAVADVCSFTLDMPAGVVHSGLDLTGATPYYFVASAGPVATQDIYLSGETLSGGTYKIITSTIGGSGTFGPIANAGVVYLVGSATASLAGASPAVAQGDFLRAETTSSLPTAYEGRTLRIQNDVVTNPYWAEAVFEYFSGGLSDTPVYTAVGDTSSFKVFKNPAQTAATIVTAVNALAAADPTVPVRPTLLGTGATKIDRDSPEDFAGSAGADYQLADGLNFVKTTTVPGTVAGDYDFTFKNDVTSSLATVSDWANEVVRIVPRTAKNVVDWLNRPTVSGLFSACEVKATAGGRKVQLASLTAGSAGSVQVQGGTANSATAAVVGSSSTGNGLMAVSVEAGSITGFQSRGWVVVDNAEMLPKTVFTSTTVLNSIVNDTATTSLLTLSGATNVYTQTQAASLSAVVIVEPQGKFMAYTDTAVGSGLTLTAVREGDWLRVTAPATPASVGGGVETMAAGNIGIFRVVRVCQDAGKQPTIWVENEAGVEQGAAEGDFYFYSDDSVMPGDILTISNTAWDGTASNRGSYEVTDVGLSFTNAQKLTVRGTLSTVGSAKPALGSGYQQIQIIEAAPARLFKQVWSISPNPTDNQLVDFKFTTDYVAKRVGEVAGSVVTALDKLDFDSGIARGVDGYRNQTGLLAQTNKVLYGDPANPSVYPGVVAAGSIVNIAGSLVKRVQVTLSLRIKTGANREKIKSWVKSAVAAVINRTSVGAAISLSDLTKAAGAVGGVVTATMVSPVQTAGNDVIVLQAYERPLVLNVDTDVLVTFVGD